MRYAGKRFFHRHLGASWAAALLFAGTLLTSSCAKKDNVALFKASVEPPPGTHVVRPCPATIEVPGDLTDPRFKMCYTYKDKKLKWHAENDQEFSVDFDVSPFTDKDPHREKSHPDGDVDDPHTLVMLHHYSVKVGNTYYDPHVIIMGGGG